MKKGITVLLVLLLAVPIAIVAVAGCGSSPTPQQAKQQLSTDLENLKGSLTEFTNPATYSSADSVNMAVDTVQTDLNAVVSSASEVKNVSAATLSSAWNDLVKSVTDTISGSGSISGKLDSVQTALKNFQQALQQLVDDLKTQ